MKSNSNNIIKDTRNEIPDLHKKLLEYTKGSGLTEISLAIFHKISTIINSIITSISILEVKMEKNSIHNFFKTIELLKQNQHSIIAYLSKDPIGSKIPEYLILLGSQIQTEINLITKEIYHIFKHVKRVSNLTHTYRTIKYIHADRTKLLLPNVIEEVIKYFSNILLTYNIKVTKDYKCCDHVVTDQEKLNQILTHLIKNAIDALILHNKPYKNINIYIKPHSTSMVTISIQDNGIGIDMKNLGKIFSFEFTNKSNGYGFNLYNSYIKAKELGGILRATSAGIGLGSIFTLILPYNL